MQAYMVDRQKAQLQQLRFVRYQSEHLKAQKLVPGRVPQPRLLYNLQHILQPDSELPFTVKSRF